ncbi:MAG: HIT family protein [Planctomycetota bacterium]
MNKASPTFADIVAGLQPVEIVASDRLHLAFLALRPMRSGHVIVVRRAVSDYLFDLPPDEHVALWRFVQVVAQTMKDRLPCERVCVSVIGWVVRHVHVHLLPTDAAGQVTLTDGPPLPAAEASAIAKRLRVSE